MIQLVLLGILLGFALIHLWGVRSRTESFVGSPELRDIADEYASPTETPDDDPRDLPWIASWSSTDAEARKGQVCIVRSESPGPDGTRLQIVSASCEDGMAHTRDGDRIVIPESIPFAVRHETIEHERIHIAQRRHPEKWLSFYQQSWGFTFHPGPPTGMPTTIVSARRSNPDTWDPDTGGPWPCWQGRWWPVPVYTAPRSPRLRAAATVWWDAQEDRVQETAPEAWIQFFGTPSQTEHPHELAAVLLTAEDTGTEAGRRLWTWWRANESFVRQPIEAQ